MQELLRPDSSITGAVELMQHGSFRALGKDNETCTVVSAGENFANTCAEVCAMVACFASQSGGSEDKSFADTAHSRHDWYTALRVISSCRPQVSLGRPTSKID